MLATTVAKHAGPISLGRFSRRTHCLSSLGGAGKVSVGDVAFVPQLGYRYGVSGVSEVAKEEWESVGMDGWPEYS